MRTKPTSKELLKRLLSDKNLPDNSLDDQSSTNIKTKLMMSVPISKIDTYQRNPRREQNPNFFKIKESIRNDGLNQPLVISQRTGNERFFIFKGGNTRLAALRELHDETRNRRFEFVDCCFLPWSGYESEAIIGHLQENQMRKSLCFIDRAFGVKSALDELKLELKRPDLTLRDCLTLLKEKGYCTTLSTLSIMQYAVEFIESTLPYGLSKTLGRPQIQRIRNLDRICRNVTKEFGIPKNVHQTLIKESLKSCYELGWSHKILRREIESNISNFTETSIQDISLRIDGYTNLSDQPLCPIPTINFENSKNLDFENSSVTRTKTVQKLPVYSVNNEEESKSSHQNGAYLKIHQSLECRKSIKTSTKIPKRITKQSIEPIVAPCLNVDPTIASHILGYRNQAFLSAWTIAKRYDFHTNPTTKERVVANLGDWGIGYMITDFPSKQNQILKSDIGLRDNLWWLLFELSDFQWALVSARTFVAKIAVNGNLVNYIRTGDSNVLYRTAKRYISYPYPFIGGLTMCARRLDHSLWVEVNMLFESYRALHEIAKQENINLFQQPKISE